MSMKFSDVYMMALEMTPKMRQHMLTLMLTSIVVDDFEAMTREEKAAEIARVSKLVRQIQANAEAANTLPRFRMRRRTEPEPAAAQAEITATIYKEILKFED